MSASWPWSVLGLFGPTDERAVKKAYALRLREIDRQDAEEFQQLREAYDMARSLARDIARHDEVSREEPYFEKSGQGAKQWRPCGGGGEYFDDAVKVEDVAWSELENPDRHADGNADVSLSQAETSLSASRSDFAVRVHQIKNCTFDKKEADHFKSILDQLLADYPQRKEDVENTVMGVLSEKMNQDPSFVLSKEYVALFEDHFKWASDGVRFLKKTEKIDVSGMLFSSIAKRKTDFLFFILKARSGWVSSFFIFPLKILFYVSLFVFMFFSHCLIFVLGFLFLRSENVTPIDHKFRKVFSIGVYRNNFGNFVLWLRGAFLFLALCQVSVWWTDRTGTSNIELQRWFTAIVLFVAFMYAVRISSEILSRASIIIIQQVRDAVRDYFVFGPDFLTDTWRPTSENWWLWIQIVVLFVVSLIFLFLNTSADVVN
ncbi:hypothetical protein LF95_02600 [Thalassospira sp. TSL5-1]|nr:hypothetical protein LF95_02600 [Thalassospira sp. TSL5-1]